MHSICCKHKDKRFNLVVAERVSLFFRRSSGTNGRTDERTACDVSQVIITRRLHSSAALQVAIGLISRFTILTLTSFDTLQLNQPLSN